MTNVTPHQIRAARALIDWSQSDLGRESGLSQAAIANIETGRHRPGDDTLASILGAFERTGIEFIDGGVRQRPDSLEIIGGDDFASRMPALYLEAMQRSGEEEVLINGVDFTLIDRQTHDAVENNIETLIRLGKRQRVLVRNGTRRSEIIGPADWYRCIPDEIFSAATPSFIYHNSFAIMLFDRRQVMIIHNANLADFQRRQFDHLWENARPLA